MMLPAKAGNCEICNHDHPPRYPHHAQSVFYQMRFYYENGGRWPTWADAMAHCDDEMKAIWIRELEAMNVKVGDALDEPRQANISFQVVPGVNLEANVTLPANAEVTDVQLQECADRGNDNGESFTRILLDATDE